MVGISSAISSIFTYFQSLGSTISINPDNMPPTLKNVAYFFSNLLNTLRDFFPIIPSFDCRFQLALLSIGIPIFLDIIFVWILSPLLDIVCQC